MRKMLMLGAGILGAAALYKNAARSSERQPQFIRNKRGDSPNAPRDVSDFMIYSTAFAPGELIPAKYSCEADDKSPPLMIEGTPEGTQSLAIILEDLDSPMPTVFDHWLVWNIPPETTGIPEGRLPVEAVQGKNSINNIHYNGPCTPNGTHHYHFKLFALDTWLDLPVGSTKPELKAAMRGAHPG